MPKFYVEEQTLHTGESLFYPLLRNDSLTKAWNSSGMVGYQYATDTAGNRIFFRTFAEAKQYLDWFAKPKVKHHEVNV